MVKCGGAHFIIIGLAHLAIVSVFGVVPDFHLSYDGYSITALEWNSTSSEVSNTGFRASLNAVQTVVLLQSDSLFCCWAFHFFFQKIAKLDFVDNKYMSDILQHNVYLYIDKKMSIIFATLFYFLLSIWFDISFDI